MDELKACQCGRKAIKTTEEKEAGQSGLYLITTTIRCEGKTEATKDQPGCNIRCSASSEEVAVKMWNTQTPELPDPCTVEQWEEITGETFPDDGLVWAWLQGDEYYSDVWEVMIYKEARGAVDFVETQILIVQTGKPASKGGESEG